MVSVATQTPWSWLRDARGAPKQSVETTDGGKERNGAGSAAVDDHSLLLPLLHETASMPGSRNGEGGRHLPNVVMAKNHESREAGGEARRREEVHLPPLVAPGNVGRGKAEPAAAGVSELEEEEMSGEEGESLPRIMSQLTDLKFPSSSSSDEHTLEEEEEEGDGREGGLTFGGSEAGKPPPYPELGVGRLPWPAVLQYLRESESEASRYFSLDRVTETEPADDQRDKGVCPRGKQKKELAEEAAGSSSGNGTGRQGGGAAGPVMEGTYSECVFCGRPAPQWSVLQSATGAGEPQSEACCPQFKEYCVLVSTCLKQMIADRASEQPARISMTLKHKKDMKTTAEEKAFALMRRKKRWEELQKRRKQRLTRTLQSSSFYSLTKQTKTIKFSLASPAVQSADWMVRERGERRQRGEKRRKSRARKGKGGETDSGALPADVLQMLNDTRPPLRALEVRAYQSSAQPFCTLLPDSTGQCYYPSGSVAVMVYSHLPGVLSFLLFNDAEEGSGGELIGFADELGRAFCYHTDSSLRLQLSAGGEGVLYSPRGGVKRRWRWGEGAGGEGSGHTPFQPLSLALSRRLSLQCSGSEQLLIGFSVGQHHIKFPVPRKLQESHVSEDVSRLGQADIYLQHLAHVQARMSHLLGALAGGRGRSRKLSELQTVYGLRASANRKPPRPRSRSTGALNLSTHTHTHTIFTRRLV